MVDLFVTHDSARDAVEDFSSYRGILSLGIRGGDVEDVICGGSREFLISPSHFVTGKRPYLRQGVEGPVASKGTSSSLHRDSVVVANACSRLMTDERLVVSLVLWSPSNPGSWSWYNRWHVAALEEVWDGREC